MARCPTCGNAPPPDARYCPFDGTLLGASSGAVRDPLIGMTIGGRYRLSNRLGAGGQSVVYLARHEALDRDVAIKILRNGAGADERVARFAREARAGSRIDHENVVCVIDFGHAAEGDFYYLVLEHVAGTPLDIEVSRRAPFPAARAVHVISQISAGMSRAHELGIVHRDLKPENVVLCNRRGDPDFVKVLDFGISKSWVRDPSLPTVTVDGEIIGTPDYMAPEQWEGQRCDARTDIYALGVIAYELLTGKTPFQGPITALVKQHMMDPPRGLRDRAPDAEIPAALEIAVLRCLEKRPEARFQSTEQLLAALRPVWSEVPRVARRTTYGLPLRSRGESIPDPTAYVSTNLDVVWDGPMLCDELARLHARRMRS